MLKPYTTENAANAFMYGPSPHRTQTTTSSVPTKHQSLAITSSPLTVSFFPPDSCALQLEAGDDGELAVRRGLRLDQDNLRAEARRAQGTPLIVLSLLPLPRCTRTCVANPVVGE